MSPKSLEKRKLSLRRKHNINSARLERVKKKTEPPRRREEWCHSALQNSMDAILLTVPDGRILAVNPEACRMFGRTEEEICRIGRNGIVDVTDPRLRIALEERAQTGKFRGELTLKRKDGTRFPGEVATAIFKDVDGAEKTIMIIRDATDQRRLAAARRESEVLYRTLFENTGTAMLVVDADTMVLAVNEELERVSGYSRTELVGKRSWTEFVAKDHLEKMKEYHNLRRVDSKAAPRTYESKLVGKRGNVVDALLTVALIPGTKKSVVSFIDVTEHKKAERELEDLAKYPAENLNPVFRLDKYGLILHANKSSEPVLQNWKCKVGGKAPKSWIDLINEAYSNQSSKSIDIQVSDRTFLFTLVPIKDAGYVNVYGRDITERKRAENALRESEEKYRLVSENIPVVVYSALPDEYSTNTFTSGRIQELTGYTVEDYAKDPILWSKILHQDDKEHVLKQMWEHVRNNTPFDMEYRIITKDGYVKWLRDKASPVLNENGEVTRIDGFMEDVTERKRLEEELKQHTIHLEELVETRTKEIQMLNSNILERLIQKTSQIENVSRIRDRLRKSPDVSTGMDLILEGALKDLEMDAGAVLVFDVKEDVADVRAFKSMTKEITLNPNYPPCRVSECEVLALDKPVSKTEGISCILGTNSIHCAPIHFGKEVYGALLLGSQKTSTLDDSDLAVLRMYAELASTVFETQRLTITPVKEESIVSERRFELEFGGVYLAKNEVERAFNIFADGVLGGLEGLCVTRIFPPTVRRKHGLEKTPIVWLTPERVEGHMTVNSLQDLSILIGNFLEKTTRSIVLLDGIEYLITNHGFESFIRFLQLNRSRIEQKESILIVPILEEAIDAKDARLIERETIALMAN